ncbi:MAG: glycosyl hydrolase 53 family protein [Roseburia sp.]
MGKRGRILPLLLAAAMTVGLVGCGNTQTGGAAQETEVATEQSDGSGSTEQTAEETGTETTEATEAAETAPRWNAEEFWANAESYTPTLPTGLEEADIFVEPVEGLSEDFICGMDISSVIAEEESGVVYYNEAGEEADLFQILADAGVNYIRVRVWNDPYDKNGNGYGGGNNDVEKAAEIGARAARCGLKLLVDFHYSDFWADPKKQMAPKAWAHLTFEDKQTALYEFTKESLQTILDAGADVGMVQIGNEINNGMSGETDWERITPLLVQGSTAVREIAAENNKDIQIAVHFTNIEDYNQIMKYPQILEEAGVDYDVFGVSYYISWHGTLENLTRVLTDISANYGKKVAVMETSYPYTLEEGDGFSNSLSETDLISGYAATVQSQANCVRDVIAATAAAGDAALGVFYWEGAWIPVGPATAKTDNEKLWETYGSGWASSFSAKYDPNDAGLYYGGSSWDNQAMFDFGGHPLASLDVFKYVRYGAQCPLEVDYVEDVTVDVNVGEEIVMPETVYVAYNDRSQSGGAPVTWEEADYADIDTSVAGEYQVKGVLEDGTEILAALKVANVNWLSNPSFEEKNVTMWTVSYEGAANPTNVQTKASDATTGENSFHFWSESEQEFSVEQTVSGLSAGNYAVNVSIQGGDVGSNAEIYLYAVVNGDTYQSDPVTLGGWCNWQVPEITGISLDGASDITVGVYVKCAGGGWGTMDDFYLYKTN